MSNFSFKTFNPYIINITQHAIAVVIITIKDNPNNIKGNKTNNENTTKINDTDS